MKKNNLRHKKSIHRVIIYTLLVLSILNFSSFSTTHSKYYDQTDDVLAYNSKLYTLTKNDLKVSLFNPKPTYTYASFEFTRNTAGLGNTSDTYKITIPNGCVYSGLPANYTIDNTGRIATVTFNSSSNVTTIINLKCTISTLQGSKPDTEKIQIPVSIREQVGSEKEFLYNHTPGNISMTYGEYKIKYPVVEDGSGISPDKKTLTISIDDLKPDTDIVEIFNNWLEEYVEEHSEVPYSGMILNYVKDKYQTADAIKELDGSGLAVYKLPGIKPMYDKDSNTYTFTTEDNLEGYARTDNASKDTTSRAMLYFSTTDTAEIDKIFEYYLKKYPYPNNTSKVTEIINYVNLISHDVGITYIMNDTNAELIKGFRYIASNNLIVIDTTSALSDYAHQVANSPIRLSYDEKPNMENTFRNLLTTSYGSIVSNEMITKLTSSSSSGGSVVLHPVLSSILKNNNNEYPTTKEEFNDYFLEYDTTNNYYLLIRSFSFAQEYNYMAIESLNYSKINNPNLDINMSVDPSFDNKLDITITNKLIITPDMLEYDIDNNLSGINDIAITSATNMQNELFEIAGAINTFMRNNNESVDNPTISDLEVLPNNPLNSDFDITSLTPNVDGNYEISYTLSYYFAKN